MILSRDPTDPLAPRPLLAAALWATAGVLATRVVALPGAALAIGVAVLSSARQRRAGPAMFAIPAALGAIQLAGPEPVVPPPGPVSIHGVAVPPVRRDSVAGRTTFRLDHAGQQSICVVPVDQVVLPGDRVSGPARLSDQVERRRRGLPLVFDASTGTLTIEPGGPSLPRLAVRERLRLQANLERAVPGEEGYLLCHLVLGTGPTLADDLVAAHRATGVTHLLAVSGAHATMLAWLLGVLFRVTSGRNPWTSRRYRRFCAGVLVTYGCVTGWEPPIVRALVAYGLLLWAAARGRRVTITAALALPALVTALWFPTDLLSASFCLSYAAVYGLALSGVLDRGDSWERWLRAPLRASMWAVITTAPLSLAYFGQIAPWTIVLTPLLAPLVAIMLGGGLLTAVLGVWAPDLAAAVGTPLRAITWLYDATVRAAAHLPATPIHADRVPDPWLLCACLCAGLTVLGLQRNRRGVATLCLLASLPHFVPHHRVDGPRLTVLAVGHGQACLLRDGRGRHVLIDCGSLANPRRASRAVVAAIADRRRIDLLILSHSDADHVSGVPHLAQQVPISRAILGAALRGHAVVAALRWAGTRITWLEPGHTIEPRSGLSVSAPIVRKASSNDRSLWVRAQFGGVRVLVPSDAGRRGIHAFLRSTRDPSADVLLLPHHGRGDADACRRLVERCGASVGLVSNRDGETSTPLGRVAAAAGCRVLHTGARGRIDVGLGPGGGIGCEWPETLGRAPR